MAMKKIIIAIAIMAACQSASFADEGVCTLSLERTRIAPGKQTQLFMIFAGAADMPVPALPFIAGLDVKYQKSMRQPVTVDGKTAEAFIHVYKVTALKAGTYRFGPLSFQYGGLTYTSTVVTLEVTRQAAAEDRLAPSADAVDLSKHIFLQFDMPRSQVFVNERLPLSVKLYSDWLDLEDVSVPDIASADLIVEGFTREPAKIVEMEGAQYAILEYRTSVIAATPGDYTLAPVKAAFFVAKRKRLPSGELPDLLNDNEIMYDKAIGSLDRLPLSLETGPIAFTARPLPSEGRPDGFKGAVGSFDLAVEAEPTRLGEGDALTLKLIVTGDGNYNTLTTIAVPPMAGFKYYEPQVIKTPASFTLQQTMRLMAPGATEIPAITFVFFDPSRGAYVSMTKDPIPLTITGFKKAAPGRDAAAPAAAKKEKTGGEELVTIKDAPGALGFFDPFFYLSGILFAVGAIPLLALLAAMLAKRRADFLASDVEYANWLEALKKSGPDISAIERALRAGEAKRFYDTVFGVMRDYLGMRLLIPAGGITEKTIDESLGDRIDDPAIIETIKGIFFDCHLARFTAVELDKRDMLKTRESVKKVIEYLNQRTYLITHGEKN